MRAAAALPLLPLQLGRLNYSTNRLLIISTKIARPVDICPVQRELGRTTLRGYYAALRLLFIRENP
jgi:hypothetical protein